MGSSVIYPDVSGLPLLNSWIETNHRFYSQRQSNRGVTLELCLPRGEDTSITVFQNIPECTPNLFCMIPAGFFSVKWISFVLFFPSHNTSHCALSTQDSFIANVAPLFLALCYWGRVNSSSWLLISVFFSMRMHSRILVSVSLVVTVT